MTEVPKPPLVPSPRSLDNLRHAAGGGPFVRELSRYERFPEALAKMEAPLKECGWYCETSDARHAWSRAVLFADHESGARLFLAIRWSRNPDRNGLMKWSRSGRSYRFSPPPTDQHSSPWYTLKSMALVLDMAADPAAPLPKELQPHGWLPYYQSGCRCEKIKHHGELGAQAALASAQKAREQGMTRRTECRYYQCPDDALSFHLTSKPGPHHAHRNQYEETLRIVGGDHHNG